MSEDAGAAAELPAGTETAAERKARIEAVLEDLKADFLRREITVEGADGKTVFMFDKMPALEGWDTLEDIRANSVQPLNLVHAGGIEPAIDALIGGLPKQFTRELRDKMFAHVRFRNHLAQTPVVLAGDEAMAFHTIGAEPIAVYNVFARALAVNFTPSLVALFDRISTIRNLILS